MKWFAFFALLLLFTTGKAQNDKFYYQNAVFSENIKTVLMYRDGFELSNPVLELGENATLVFKFDDLSPEKRDYNYTVIHCDANWNESFLSQNEYIEGIPDNPLYDYQLSFNTTFKYTNYLLTLPNDNVRFKLSGNYILIVYENGKRDNVLISQRFYIVEPLTQIEGTIRRATADAFQGENHEIDFTIVHPKLRIDNPQKDVSVVLMQNNRWDNAIRNLKPLFIRNNALIYDYNRENVFPAGNEFRYFDNRTNRMNGENILATDFFRPYFHKTVVPDQVRTNKNYFQYKEMNGKYVIESQDREVRDPDTECDYTLVHFSLPLESPLLGGSVNVFGALTGWNANKSNEMTWNFTKGGYELTLLLKQGYYNYQYVYVPQGSLKADHTNIEGSFWEAENDYQVFVYYRDFSGRYDRLVGYRVLNSLVNRR